MMQLKGGPRVESVAMIARDHQMMVRLRMRSVLRRKTDWRKSDQNNSKRGKYKHAPATYGAP
jgi:hypothetical protein